MSSFEMFNRMKWKFKIPIWSKLAMKKQWCHREKIILWTFCAHLIFHIATFIERKHQAIGPAKNTYLRWSYAKLCFMYSSDRNNFESLDVAEANASATILVWQLFLFKFLKQVHQQWADITMATQHNWRNCSGVVRQHNAISCWCCLSLL